MNADDALNKLMEGNLRYVNAAEAGKPLDSAVKKHKVIPKQTPMAIVLGCSDSRVPAELVFDQGIGDLFVIRVAGNIATPSQIGSIEFACQNFKTQLVVVLGHSQCGAISATVDSLDADRSQLSPNLAEIVEQVTPAVRPVVADSAGQDREQILHQAMQANVEHSTQQIQAHSQVIRDLIDQGQLKIVGADYSLETGKVEFYS